MKNETTTTVNDEDEEMRNADADSPQSSVDNEQEGEFEFEFGDLSFETDGSILVAYTKTHLASPIYLIKVN